MVKTGSIPVLKIYLSPTKESYKHSAMVAHDPVKVELSVQFRLFKKNDFLTWIDNFLQFNFTFY